MFKGKRGEQLVNNWLKEAERVAQSAGWNETEKIKYFSDRLRSDAADWHSEYMERAQDKDDYEEWEKSLIKRFLTETEIENLKKQLSELKQTADQSTQTFVNRINQLYDIIHGKEIIIDFRTAAPEAKALAISLNKIRSEAKTKILLKGLLPKIEKVVWSRMDVNSSYEDVCDMAYAAETIVNRMEQNDDRSLKATIAGISAHEDEQDVEILRQKAKISKLEKQLATLNLNTKSMQDSDVAETPSVAVAEGYNRHRSPSGDRRRSRSENRIRFQQPYTRQHSADKNYSRSRGRENSDFRSRSASGNRYSQQPTGRRRDPTPPPPNYNNRSTERQQFRNPNNNIQRRNHYSNNYTQTRNQNTPYVRYPQERNSQFQNAENTGARPRNNSWYNDQPNQRTKRNIDCYACGKRGHYARECRSRPMQSQPQQ